jgi:Putative beta-barrel porin-2, OmpL-like. bbp2
MTKQLLTLVISAIGISNQVNAQDSTKSVSFSGGLDGYYRHNFAVNSANNFTSFTNSQNSFELGMATLRADATALSGKVTATIDLGFGRRAEDFSYNDGTLDAKKNGFISLQSIKQAYITYAPSSKVKFTMGKFGTHVGYELVDAQLNRNYSMSYMFTNGPFFHTGAKADITAGQFGFMLGVANYTDQSTATNNVKSVLAQVSGATKNGKLKAFLNYVGSYGSNQKAIFAVPSTLEALTQLDLVVNATLSSKFSLGYNGTVQSRNDGTDSKSWWGSAVYLNYDPTAAVGFTWRNEYIGDKNLLLTGAKNVLASTMSLNYKVGPLTLIPELRFENAESAIYTKKDGTGGKSTMSALFACVYKF